MDFMISGRKERFVQDVYIAASKILDLTLEGFGSDGQQGCVLMDLTAPRNIRHRDEAAHSEDDFTARM